MWEQIPRNRQSRSVIGGSRVLGKFFIWLPIPFTSIGLDTWKGDLKSDVVAVLSCPRSKPWPGVWFRGRAGCEIGTQEMWGPFRLLDVGFLSSENVLRSLFSLNRCRSSELAAAFQYFKQKSCCWKAWLWTTLIPDKAAFGASVS